MKFEDIDKIITFLERLKVLLFGKTSDWIAKTILVSGILMMSEPLLEKLINLFLEEYFNLTITGENDVCWGFLLVLISALLSLREQIFNYFIKHLKLKRWKILIPNFLNEFQSLNDSLNNYTILFNEYTYCIANKGNGCASDHDKDRVKYDEQLFKSITKLESILGKKVAMFFFEVRKIVSKPFHPEIDIYYELHNLCTKKYKNVRPYSATKAATEIYNNYFNAIKEINEIIIKYDIDEKQFYEILDKYNIDKNYNTKLKGLEYNLAEEYILRRHKYY